MRRPSDPLFRDLVEEYTLGLAGAGRSPETAKAYTYALTDLEDWLTASGHAPDPEQITVRGHTGACFAAQHKARLRASARPRPPARAIPSS